MGSNQFQKEYIEYLQEQNTELLNRLNHMKENYENKILSDNINKHYLISALEEVMHICTVIPQEIDLFFDKITAALSAFKGLLLRKSEMLQMVEKITKAINPDKFNNDVTTVEGSKLISEQISGSRAGKKVGMVKVSPMINGHVISTEPKIYLNRVPGMLTPNGRRETHELSPIMEASPDTSPDLSSLRSNVFKEIKIPLERININKLSEESPKTRFKGPKTWKKSLSSYERHGNSQRKTAHLENNGKLNKKLSAGENVPDNDPLEGPSWLYEESSGMNPSLGRFIDYRRRRRRFASVFDQAEDCLVYSEDRSEKSSKEDDDNEFYEELEKTDGKISGSPEDFICDSFTSDDNASSLLSRNRFSKRKQAEKASKDDSTESEGDSRKEIPTFLEPKNKKKKSVYSDSSDDGDDKENSVRGVSKGRKTCRKLSLKSSVEGMSKEEMELSFENMPSSSGLSGRKSRTGNKSTDMEIMDTSENVGNITTEKEMFVKLNDCLSTEESLPRRSAAGISNEGKKFKDCKTKSKSNSLAVKLTESEGRKKRKAAPSFKLVEPKLNVKLRRS